MLSANNFADVLLLQWALPAVLNTVRELEAPCLSSGLVLEHFSWLIKEEVDKILTAVNPTICLLDPCLLWLVKACNNVVHSPQGDCQFVPIIGDLPGEAAGDSGVSSTQKKSLAQWSLQITIQF